MYFFQQQGMQTLVRLSIQTPIGRCVGSGSRFLLASAKRQQHVTHTDMKAKQLWFPCGPATTPLSPNPNQKRPKENLYADVLFPLTTWPMA